MSTTGQMERIEQERSSLFAPDDYLRLESWYNDIKDLTFRTETIDLSLAACEAMAKVREHQLAISQARRWLQEGQEVPAEMAEGADPRQALNQEQRDMLEAVEAEVDALLDRWGISACFVKLSSRSPKDVALRMPRMYDLMEKDLERSFRDRNAEDYDYTEWLTAAMQSFVRCGISVLQVKSGRQAIDLLLQSQRVLEDITNLKLLQGEDKFELKLVVREWVEIDPVFEFRSFVHEGRLTGITQYYHICFAQEMVDHHNTIDRILREFWKTEIDPRVRDRVQNYTADLAIIPPEDWSQLSTANVRVVELGHTWPTAGTSLFDPQHNKDDREALISGEELRVLQQPPPDALRLIHRSFQDFFATVAPAHLRQAVLDHSDAAPAHGATSSKGHASTKDAVETGHDRKCAVM